MVVSSLMKLCRLERSQVVAWPLEEIFDFFADPRSLGQVTPPSLHFHFLHEPPPRMEAGTVLGYWVRLHGVPVRCVRRIDEFESPRRLIDSQISGPYAYWRTHLFEAVSKRTQRGTDRGTDAFPWYRYFISAAPRAG
jgi:ligand-binding SRPBCC domain-containing protein